MKNTIAPHHESKSVIQRSMTSGVFASNDFVGNNEEFADYVVDHWHRQTNESPTMAHYEAAKDLHSFYEKYREACNAGHTGSKSVFQLYETGLISAAMDMLRSEVLTSSSLAGVLH